MASTFEVSICKGVFVTLCKLMMALSITAGSSSSGRPTFTSRMSAPCSVCAMPSRHRYSKSPSRKACFKRGLPVGLMRSPIKIGRAPNVTVCVYEDTTVFFSM